VYLYIVWLSVKGEEFTAVNVFVMGQAIFSDHTCCYVNTYIHSQTKH